MRRALFPLLLALPLLAQDPGTPAAPAAAPSATPAAAPEAAAAKPTAPALPPQPFLDKGLLDPAYFGIKSTDFHEHDWADFVWVKPGFSLKGRKLKVAWEAPHWLNTKNDKGDLDAGESLTKTFPQALTKGLQEGIGEGIAFSETEGDLLLTGRIVELNARGSIWSPSRDMMTFDLKVVDPASGEAVLAVHQRILDAMGFGTKGKGILIRTPSFTKDMSAYIKANLMK
ncbi:MAG TPA: hypothetical protein VJ570_09930 [Holophagaceae bacterium]|nr:hypothetical protein [Holophagaceae bacterium]